MRKVERQNPTAALLDAAAYELGEAAWAARGYEEGDTYGRLAERLHRLARVRQDAVDGEARAAALIAAQRSVVALMACWPEADAAIAALQCAVADGEDRATERALVQAAGVAVLAYHLRRPMAVARGADETAADSMRLCWSCVEGIGGACGGPDGPWHLGPVGTTCEASDCPRGACPTGGGFGGATITPERIRALETEAGQAGDTLMVALCRIAQGYRLADGDLDRLPLTAEERAELAATTREQAYKACAAVLGDAAAQADDAGGGR